MKQILSSLGIFFFAGFTLFAQAPQAVCYQAAAKDLQGNDLREQDISIRASIVRGNPDGSVEWQETHDVTTDAFGLFTLEVGEGNSTGGTLTDFADIAWNDGEYWLRIEMDAAAGTNFTLMGATKILSVPYALHAETAKTATDDLDRDSTNELQTLSVEDNTLSISGGNSVALSGGAAFNFPGASYNLPQGLAGEHVVLTDQSFTVPAGKTLYLTAAGATVKIHGVGLPGADFTVHPTAPNMPVFGEEAQISECYCTGILVETDTLVEPVIINLSSVPPSWSVPFGKVLFLKSGFPADLPGKLSVNNQLMEFFNPTTNRGSLIVTFPEGILLKKPAIYTELVLTGYLIDAGN